MIKLFYFVLLGLLPGIMGCSGGRLPDAAEDSAGQSFREPVEVPVGRGSGYMEEGIFKGGVITDGADVRRILSGKDNGTESIEISVYRWTGYDDTEEPFPMDEPPYFVAEKRSHPHSMEIFFAGTRAFSVFEDMDSLNEEFKDSGLVYHVGRLAVMDDSAGKILITFKDNVQFQIYQLQSPARIVIDLKKSDNPGMLDEVFSVRTHSGISGESGELLRERLEVITASPNRYLFDGKGELFIEAGRYPEMQKAKSMKEQIEKKVPGIQLFIEKRGAAEVPVNITGN